MLASASVATALASTRQDPKVLPKLKAAAVAPSPSARVSRPRCVRWRITPPYDPSTRPMTGARVSDHPTSALTLAAVAGLGSTEDQLTLLPTLERFGEKTASNPRVRVYAEEALTRVKAGGKKASLK